MNVTLQLLFITVWITEFFGLESFQNKILIYVMPIVMAMFALFYNAMFALYMVTGSLFGLATSPLITMLVDKVYEKSVKKEEEKTRVSYSRK